MSCFLLFLLIAKSAQSKCLLSMDMYSMRWFLFYQIIHILPIAIAGSSFTASLLTMRKLRQENILRSLLTAGISLRYLLLPMLFCAFLLSFVTITAIHTASSAKRSLRVLLLETAEKSPLSLLRNQEIGGVDLWFSSSEDEAFQLFIGKQKNRFFILEGKLDVKEHALEAKHVSFVSYHRPFVGFPTVQTTFYEKIQSPLHQLEVIKPPPQRKKNSLSFTELLFSSFFSPEERLHELARRLCLALSPFSFTYLGCSLLSGQSRFSRAKPFVIGSIYFLGFLLLYAVAKNSKPFWILGCAVFALEQLILLSVSTFFFYRNQRGYDG